MPGNWQYCVCSSSCQRPQLGRTAPPRGPRSRRKRTRPEKDARFVARKRSRRISSGSYQGQTAHHAGWLLPRGQARDNSEESTVGSSTILGCEEERAWKLPDGCESARRHTVLETREPAREMMTTVRHPPQRPCCSTRTLPQGIPLAVRGTGGGRGRSLAGSQQLLDYPGLFPGETVMLHTRAIAGQDTALPGLDVYGAGGRLESPSCPPPAFSSPPPRQRSCSSSSSPLALAGPLSPPAFIYKCLSLRYPTLPGYCPFTHLSSRLPFSHHLPPVCPTYLHPHPFQNRLCTMASTVGKVSAVCQGSRGPTKKPVFASQR